MIVSHPGLQGCNSSSLSRTRLAWVLLSRSAWAGRRAVSTGGLHERQSSLSSLFPLSLSVILSLTLCLSRCLSLSVSMPLCLSLSYLSVILPLPLSYFCHPPSLSFSYLSYLSGTLSPSFSQRFISFCKPPPSLSVCNPSSLCHPPSLSRSLSRSVLCLFFSLPHSFSLSFSHPSVCLCAVCCALFHQCSECLVCTGGK